MMADKQEYQKNIGKWLLWRSGSSVKLGMISSVIQAHQDIREVLPKGTSLTAVRAKEKVGHARFLIQVPRFSMYYFCDLAPHWYARSVFDLKAKNNTDGPFLITVPQKEHSFGAGLLSDTEKNVLLPLLKGMNIGPDEVTLGVPMLLLSKLV